MNPNFMDVGQQFAKLYYQAFDSDRSNLAPLYSHDSMLTFEGEQFQGTAKIVEKLTAFWIDSFLFDKIPMFDLSLLFSNLHSKFGHSIQTFKILVTLESLPFKSVQHAITTIDCQPSAENGVIVFVVGQLKTDNDHPHSFSQTFFLKPCASSYYVLNDVFRLSLHNG